MCIFTLSIDQFMLHTCMRVLSLITSIQFWELANFSLIWALKRKSFTLLTASMSFYYENGFELKFIAFIRVMRQALHIDSSLFDIDEREVQTIQSIYIITFRKIQCPTDNYHLLICIMFPLNNTHTNWMVTGYMCTTSFRVHCLLSQK